MSYTSEVAERTGSIYEELEKKQSQWYEKTKFTCPSGCGCCCHNFEPDLMECESIFMAKWLVENKKDVALQLAEGNFNPDYEKYSERTCIFFDPVSDYHCTIYGGRPFICRLFGASSVKDKNEEIVWRPCKFYPQDELTKYNKILSHKTYSQKEAESILGKVPPVMSDIMEQSLSIVPSGTETYPLREILPKTIRKVLMEEQLGTSKNCNF